MSDPDKFDPATASTPEEFSKCLEALRLRRGLTLRQLETAAAEHRLALSRATARRLETGTFPSHDHLIAFLVACGVPPGEGGDWERSWRQLAPHYPRGRRMSIRRHSAGTSTESDGGVSLEPSATASSVLHSEILGLLADLSVKVKNLRDAPAREPSALALDTRSAIRFMLETIDSSTISTTLGMTLRFDRPIANPRFYLIVSGSPLPLPVASSMARSALWEYWMVAEAEISRFATDVTEIMRFSVGDTLDRNAARLVNRDAFRVLAEEEIRGLELLRIPENLDLTRFCVLDIDLSILDDGTRCDDVILVDYEVTVSSSSSDSRNFVSWTPPWPMLVQEFELDMTQFDRLEPTRPVVLSARTSNKVLTPVWGEAGAGVIKTAIDSMMGTGDDVFFSWGNST